MALYSATSTSERIRFNILNKKTGNRVRNLVIDSLKYWNESLGADGFRFDLAAILGNANARGRLPAMFSMKVDDWSMSPTANTPASGPASVLADAATATAVAPNSR